MTDITPTHPDRDLLRRLFNRAMEAGPTTAAINRLLYCHMLDRITAGDLNIALEQFSDPGTVDAALAELDSLSDDERERLAKSVCPIWNDALSRSVVLMYRACRRLGYDAEGLNGEHLAILASILLCSDDTPDS